MGEQTLKGSGGGELGEHWLHGDGLDPFLYSGQLRQTQTLYYEDETGKLKYWKIIFIYIYIHVKIIDIN